MLEPSDKQAENETPFASRSTLIEHHELRYTEHLSKNEQCHNAPEHIRKEALQRFATKRGVENSQKAADPLRNWTFQPPLTLGNEGGEGDTGVMGLEDTPAEELEVEFDRLHLGTLKTDSNSRSGHFRVKLLLLPQNFTRCTIWGGDAMRKGITLQPAGEEPTIQYSRSN